MVPLGAMNTTSGRLEKRLTNDSELFMAWPFRNFWSSSRLAARVSTSSSEAGVTGGRTVTQKRKTTSGTALTHIFPNLIFPTSEHVHRHLGCESLQEDQRPAVSHAFSAIWIASVAGGSKSLSAKPSSLRMRAAQLAIAADRAPFVGPAAVPPGALQFARVMS